MIKHTETLAQKKKQRSKKLRQKKEIGLRDGSQQCAIWRKYLKKYVFLHPEQILVTHVDFTINEVHGFHSVARFSTMQNFPPPQKTTARVKKRNPATLFFFICGCHTLLS